QLKGQLSLAKGDGDQALREFDAGLGVFPTPGNALIQAAALGSAGYPRQGLAHLRHFESLPPAAIAPVRDMSSLHACLLDRLGYWRSERTHMEAQLREDASGAGPAAGGGT